MAAGHTTGWAGRWSKAGPGCEEVGEGGANGEVHVACQIVSPAMVPALGKVAWRFDKTELAGAAGGDAGSQLLAVLICMTPRESHGKEKAKHRQTAGKGLGDGREGGNKSGDECRRALARRRS